MLAGDAGGLPACADDLRGGCEADLGGAAEPGAVPFACSAVCREVNGNRVVVSVPGGAVPAGDGDADGRAPVVTVPGECGERVPERGFGDAGERGQAPGVTGLQQSRFGDVVAGGGPDGEPWRQDIGDRAEREVVRGCRPGQVRGDRLARQRRGADRKGCGPLFAGGGDGLPGLAGAAGDGDAVAAEFAGERGVAAGVAQGGDLAVQPGPAQMEVIAGALPEVGGERGEGVRVRARLAGAGAR